MQNIENMDTNEIYDEIQIHEGSDDMGLGGTAASRSGGNAGTKIACCIIGRDAVP